MALASRLSHMEETPNDPIVLYQNWFADAQYHGVPTNFMNLATATRCGAVSSRTVQIKEILPDGAFAFLTDQTSRTNQNILENPQVAVTVFLLYTKNARQITRQVRFTGTAEELPFQQYQVYFEQEPLSERIRAWLYKSDVSSNWEELKKKHDEILNKVRSGVILETPDNVVAYRIVFKEIEFYYSDDGGIPDRLRFELVGGTWVKEHLKP